MIVKNNVNVSCGKRNHQIILLHNNARPYVASATKDTLMKLEWEILSHSAYSSDFALFDYYLFRLM